MTRRSYRSPLLVTRCDGCYRRRVCHAICFTGTAWWLCPKCCRVVILAGKVALAEFARQGRGK